jgi:hypothetical protein
MPCLRGKMGKEINQLFQEIKEHNDKIFVTPLHPKTIEQLQNKINITFPDCYSDYLLNIGFFQDLIKGLFFSTESELISEHNFLYEHIKKNTSQYFAFGSDGSGNLFLLKDNAYSGECCHPVRFYPATSNFFTFLQSGIQ